MAAIQPEDGASSTMRSIPDTIDASCGEELRAQLRRGVPSDVMDYFPCWATSYATGARPGVDAQGCGPGMWLNVQLVQRAVAAGLQVPMTGMLFATGDWKAYMLRLKKKDCKMMGQTPAVALVVLLTKAPFRSGPCLDEIAVARANKMTVILLRCEDDLPVEGDMWPLPEKLKEAGATDQIQAYMLKRGDVVEWMGSENSVPTPGNTILTLPSAFDTFLGELRAATPAAAWAAPAAKTPWAAPAAKTPCLATKTGAMMKLVGRKTGAMWQKQDCTLVGDVLHSRSKGQPEAKIDFLAQLVQLEEHVHVGRRSSTGRRSSIDQRDFEQYAFRLVILDQPSVLLAPETSVLLAPKTAEDKEAWLRALRKPLARSIMQRNGCCSWFQVGTLPPPASKVDAPHLRAHTDPVASSRFLPTTVGPGGQYLGRRPSS
jgi:hypothetical protein